jgi:hypothetical protein
MYRKRVAGDHKTVVHIAMRPAHRSSDKNKLTVHTITARRDNGRWSFVFYQNTLGTH